MTTCLALPPHSRCVFVTWVGAHLPPLVRARVSMHKSDVMNWYAPVVTFDVDDRNDPSLCESVCAKIRNELSSVGSAKVRAATRLPGDWPRVGSGGEESSVLCP